MNKFSSTIHRLSCGIDVIARVRKDAHGSTNIVLYRPDTCQEAVIPTQPLKDFRFDSPGIESFVNLHKDFLSTSGFFLSKVDTKAKTETVLTLEPSAVEDIYSLLGLAQKWWSCLDGTDDLQNCIDSAKRCIALSRKELRRRRVSLINLNVQPLKETISAAYRVLGEINVKKGLLNKAAACFTLSLHSNGNSTEEESCIRSILSSVLQNDCVSSESIKVKESLELKNIDDRAAFSCTMCGECCRNPNRGAMTPQDLFLMSRAPSMHVLGINSTCSLFRHELFKSALTLELLDSGFPSFRLATQSASSSCYFSYPLFASGGIVLSYEDYRAHIQTDQYFRRDGGGIDYNDDDAGCDEKVDVSPPLPIKNSFERNALGCMLGPTHMPTICLIYPFNYELSVADEWHVRRKSDSRALATGWEVEESLAVSNKCEGFLNDSGTITPLISYDSRISYDSKVTRHAARERTIGQLLEGNKVDTPERLREGEWFRGLVDDLSLILRPKDVLNENIRRLFVSELVKIWFNFDALGTAKKRPIKSFARLKKEIETLSLSLASATKYFLEKGDIDDEEGYAQLIRRLDL